jgi:CheY-like chemotaxis protein
MKNTFAARPAILIADNEAGIRKTLEEIIHFAFPEMTVDLAEDGQECIENCQKNGYDLLFLNIHMPKMDGFQALEAIKKLAKKPKIWVMSGAFQDSAENTARFQKLGAQGFLLKPFDLYRIIDCIEQDLQIKSPEFAEKKGRKQCFRPFFIPKRLKSPSSFCIAETCHARS